MSRPVSFKPISLLQRFIGFVLGFIFSGAVTERLIGFTQGSGEALPTQVPLLTDLLIAGGGLGIAVVFILIILGIKAFKFFSTFLTWVLLGILASMLASFLGMRIGEMLVGIWPF